MFHDDFISFGYLRNVSMKRMLVFSLFIYLTLTWTWM